MKIEKLPSGSYRVRKMYKGKTYSVIFNHKPSQKDVTLALADEINTESENRQRMTFKTAAERYCEVKKGVLSPSTLRGYKSLREGVSERFSGLLINDITCEDIQREISKYSKTHSPKSTRNFHGFIYSVMGMYRPKLIITTTLPKSKKKETYIPTDDDIQRLISKVSGTRYEVPYLLALFGLRRSEICALTLDDFSDHDVSISKALVQNEDQEWVLKDMTKTEDGTRRVRLPEYVIQKVREQGYVYKGSPGRLHAYLSECEKALGIPHFPLHYLRHYFASVYHSLGAPDEYLMAAGGWKSSATLKRYRHAMTDKRDDMEDMVGEYLLEVVGKS